MANKDTLLQRTINNIRSFMAKRTFGTPERNQALKNFASRVKPILQQVIQPTIRAFREGTPAYGRLGSYTNPLIRLQSRYNPQVKKEITPQKGDIAKTARLGVTAYGLTKMKPLGALAMGGLSGGLSKITGGKFGEGFARGIGQYPQVAGVVGATNPILAKIMPAKWGQVGTRGIGALANVAQGLGIDVATKMPTTPVSVGLDVLTGALGGKGQFKTVTSQMTEGEYKQLSEHIQLMINKKRLLSKSSGSKIAIRHLDTAIQKAQDLLHYKRIAEGGVLKFAQEGKQPKIKIKPQAELKTGRLEQPLLPQQGKILPSPTLKDVSTLPQVGKLKVDVAGESRGVLKKAKKEIGEYTPKVKTAKQSLNQFYTDWVNRFHPIEQVTAKIEKETGTKIIPKLSPKYTTKQLLGAGGTAGLRHKQKLQPTLDMLDNLKIDKSDMDVFLKAKRDIGFGEVGRKIKGSNPKLAQTRISALGQKYDLKQLDNIASNLYKYQDDGLQMLYNSGFISNNTRKTIKAQNKYYVPFERVMDSVDNYLGLPTRKAQQATQPIKKIKGSKRQIISPIESIIANTYKIEAATAKNRVANSLVNLRNVAPKYKDLFKQVSKSTNNTISVWQKGKKAFFDVGEDLAKSIKGLNEESMGTITKILAAPARLLRQGATGRNIDFMIPNVFKDQLDAAVSSKYGYKPFIDYFRGLGHLINYKRTGSDEIVEGYLKSGGSIFFESMSGRKAIKEQIADVTVKKGVLKTLRNWALGGIEQIGEISETPTRLGLFKRGLEKTSNPLLAAYEAREGTLDFARMGAKMKTANAIVPFLNVGVQGFDKLVRNIKAHPGKMALNMTIYAGLPAAITAIYNNLFYPKELTKIPSWEKENNFIIITGQGKEGRAKYIKLPKGNIVPFIANPTEHFIAWVAKNNSQSFTQMAMNLLSEGLPILKGGQTPKEIASRTVGGLLPQAFKPGIEQLANYSFFKGKEIVPNYLKAKPVWEQTTKYTERTYNKLGDILSASPLKIKNMLEGYFSGYVKVPTHIIETVMNIADGKRVEKNKIPIIRRFIGESLPAKTLARMKGRQETAKIKAKELKASRPGLLQRIIKPGVEIRATEEMPLPETNEDLSIIYKQNQNVIDSYQKKKTKLQYGDYAEWEKKSKLQDLQDDFDFAINQQDSIKKQNPQLADDYDYYNIAKKTNAEKTNYVLDELSNLAGKTNDRGKMLEWLVSKRVEVNDKMVLSNGVIDDLYDEGIINYQERKELKALKFDKKTGRVRLKITGRGKSAKIKKIKVTPVKPRKARFIKAKGFTKKARFRITKEEGKKIQL